MRSLLAGLASTAVIAPASRVLVRSMVERGLSGRRAPAVVGMSASALRYILAPTGMPPLRARIDALAHPHRRYGAGMIHLKLRQASVAHGLASAQCRPRRLPPRALYSVA